MNFAMLMLILLVLTGAIWLLDHFVLRKHRSPEAKDPWWIEYPKSFFPVILVVFLLRSFLVEPFKIPSGSMIPTLLVGDYILVNKFAYGIRLPIVNQKIIEISDPKRGDVMVFRYPENPTLDYIKRVIGLPGDVIVYRGKRLYVNDKPAILEPAGDYSYIESGLSFVMNRQYREMIDGANHYILINPEVPAVFQAGVRQFPYRQNCAYNDDEIVCKVPSGHYFMMGDNRDSSSDSRYWGFVPEKNIVGKAFMIWWNFGEFGRIGRHID